ncbi:(2Fe-2S)-binding protein [Sphaerobacter thermophilus]|uniref:(2Fe-2S)-binding domain protein n=1 Tax=Sphaerobacter thermophilus (strain ATCC 49802 / DSM 20745 / KCCM 41009 / NCIMB 13125 / S 6022) TaxID=479434 RepID=D1C6D2_SPHTD|nr:(2Fe-2S)-binding protein [Sphaerobacter thermophilus]ACZ37670.1 (2Fe-2S)-binding domain protein [Sphaerobacter thermophilus DSM 20745]
MSAEVTTRQRISVTVNGVTHERDVDVRRLLADFLRYDLGLTGTHVGCEQGVCGACTVLLDGEAVRSCITMAVQADGCSITTIEGLAPGPGELHPIQQAFWEHHGLQCGFCTPGFVISAYAFLQDNPRPSRDEIREALSGNLCRCTGYKNIVDAVEAVAEAMAATARTGD